MRQLKSEQKTGCLDGLVPGMMGERDEFEVINNRDEKAQPKGWALECGSSTSSEIATQLIVIQLYLWL
ncbi:MAG: hypothetical protein ACRDC6_09940 [Shewanella sp.]